MSMEALDPFDPLRHLAFDTEADAILAEAEITAAMGFGEPGEVTQRWDVPRLCADGRWIIAKPPS